MGDNAVNLADGFDETGFAALEPEVQAAVVTSLTDQFIHRHNFYWSSLYRQLVYMFAILGFPYIASATVGHERPIVEILLFTVTVLTSFGLVWLVRQSAQYLDQEDLRMKQVLMTLRRVMRKLGAPIEAPKPSPASAAPTLGAPVVRSIVWLFYGLAPMNILVALAYFDVSGKLVDLLCSCTGCGGR